VIIIALPPTSQCNFRSIIFNTVRTMTSSSEQCVAPRRSLFPSSYAKKQNKRKNLEVSFSPYARCVKIGSHREMTEEERGLVWWQKSDYDGFARVSRIISKAMLEGGSEIWLVPQTAGSMKVGTASENCKVSDNAPSTPPRASSIGAPGKPPGAPRPIVATVTSDPKLIQGFHETRDKWWHKFGHSRRGLEHVASIMEGRQRQTNARLANRAVLEEQQRQQMMFQQERSNLGPGTSSSSTIDAWYLDAGKVRIVYLQHTQWARALSRAAGESDADAVRTNFDESKRKPREFYLKTYFSKDASSCAGLSDWESMDLPLFMQGVLKIRSNKFDENTSSQLRFQRMKAMRPIPEKCLNKISSAHVPDLHKNAHKLQKETSKPPSAEVAEEKKCENEDDGIMVGHLGEPITSPKSLAKKAAGWGVKTSGAKDMSAVLTGMGTFP
jgi:hypothetical protein